MYQAKLKDYLRETRLFQARAITAAILVVGLLLVLVLRLVTLQIIEHRHFTTLSTDNRVKVEPLPPTRGLIYDRNGVILAQNLPTYSLEIIPEKIDNLEETLLALGEIIDISDSDRKRFQRLKKQRRRFDGVPIKIRLNEEEVAKFAVNRHRFPGISVNAKLLRDYPLKELTAHVLGYVGRINERELKTIDNSNYSGTTHIGKTGVEKFYEDQLHGKVGLRQVETNVIGRIVRVLQNTPPTPGQDLYLTLDAKLQKVTAESFGDNLGAAVAIDPSTGDILAFVSKPGFNPNLFVEGITPKDYKALQQSEDKPLFNRALRGQYPPGSTVKPFIGLAGLEYGTVYFDQRKFCGGYYQLPNHSHKYRDWKKRGHGSVDMSDAIIQSCDVYYYDLAFQMGIDRIHEFMAQFGFGQRTGIDITGELGGLLPSREWKKSARKASWYPGETLITGIGQGYFLTTPLQLANATATLAAGGKHRVPRVVQATKSMQDDVPQLISLKTPLEIPHKTQQNWDNVVHAMSQVIESPRGTARKIRSEHYRIAGKTGTAQVFTVKQEEKYEEEKVAKKNRDHALFVTFAPVESPRIAIAIIVENGGHGGAVAAPIAKRMMDQYLLGATQ